MRIHVTLSFILSTSLFLIGACTSKAEEGRPDPGKGANEEKGNEESLNNDLDLAKSMATKQFGERVERVELIDSAPLMRVTKGRSVYRVRVSSRSRSGPSSHYYSLILDDEEGLFVKEDKDAAAFLTAQPGPIPDLSSALDYILAFAELRRFKLSLKKLEGTNAKIRKEKSDDWVMNIEDHKDGWKFDCTFLMDPEIKLCFRYSFVISRSGEVSVTRGESIFYTGLYE